MAESSEQHTKAEQFIIGRDDTAGAVLDQIFVLLDDWLSSWLAFESPDHDRIALEDLPNALVCRVDADRPRPSWAGLFVPTVAYGDWVAGQVLYCGQLSGDMGAGAGAGAGAGTGAEAGKEASVPMRFCTSVSGLVGTTLLSSLELDGRRVVRRIDRHPSGDVFVSVRGWGGVEAGAESGSGSVLHGRREHGKDGRGGIEDVVSAAGEHAAGEHAANKAEEAAGREEDSWTRWMRVRESATRAGEERYMFVGDHFRVGGAGQRWVGTRKEQCRMRWRCTSLEGAGKEVWGMELLQAVQRGLFAMGESGGGVSSQDVRVGASVRSTSDSTSASPRSTSAAASSSEPRRQRRRRVGKKKVCWSVGLLVC